MKRYGVVEEYYDNLDSQSTQKKISDKVARNKQFALNFIEFIRLLNMSDPINIKQLAEDIIKNRINFNSKSGLRLNVTEKYLPIQAFEIENYNNSKAQLGIVKRNGKNNFKEVDCSIQNLIEYFTKKRKISKKTKSLNYMWQLKRSLGLAIEYLFVAEFQEEYYPNLQHISTGQEAYDFLVYKEYKEAKEKKDFHYITGHRVVGRHIFYPVDLKLHYGNLSVAENQSIYNVDIKVTQERLEIILELFITNDMEKLSKVLKGVRNRVEKEIIHRNDFKYIEHYEYE